MDIIFYGLIFLLIDIRINYVSLMPAFVGYILMYVGLGKVRHESSRFAALRPWCLGMAVYRGCLNILSLLGSFDGNGTALLSSLINTAAGLYILYRLVQGVAETESHYPGAELEAKTLRQRWQWLLAADVVLLLAFIGAGAFFTLLAALAGFTVSVLFLMAFHRCRRAYAAAVKKAAADGENAEPQGPDVE
ncbi:MAG: hypothetical protein ACI3W8_01725 [Oscillospiraceae bacterium]